MNELIQKIAVYALPVLFAMRPQYRAQSYLTFKMFFNALTYFE